jgi:hypothetical protein
MEERECKAKDCRRSIKFSADRMPGQDWIKIVCSICKTLNYVSLIRVQEEIKQVDLV